MRIPLAWRNLTNSLPRLCLSVAGITFAVMLMFIQQGFQNALFDSTVKLVTDLDADILLISRARFTLSTSDRIPLTRIYKARRCPGVQSADPLYLESVVSLLRTRNHPARLIRVIGFDPSADLFVTEGIRSQLNHISARQALIDIKSKRSFGLQLPPLRFPMPEPVELCGRELALVGGFEMGTDFANEGNLVISLQDFSRAFPFRNPRGNPLDVVDLGVIRCAPSSDQEQILQVKHRLEQMLQGTETAVKTKQELIDQEIDFWASNTPIGVMFQMGTFLGFVVGVIICYRVIYNDISDNLSEFATLKAMGYGTAYFVRYVLLESIYLCLFGYLPGLMLSMLFYDRVARATGLLMQMTFSTAGWVLALTFGMCILSGLLALRRLISADPADNF